ncbi:hypothetical protein CDAR_433591 [Caerostris darwini]|uniref:Uncharacterized protein n=1 Tax=Caerostris darwini TaxID=1538125 RepID=A0AAV4QM92_9ARAC|nr:hypothetical protein CDAR_433591 [Caerostris darwini]
MRRKAAFSGPDGKFMKNIYHFSISNHCNFDNQLSIHDKLGFDCNLVLMSYDDHAEPDQKNVKPHGELTEKCVLCSQTTTSKNSKMPKQSVTRKGVSWPVSEVAKNKTIQGMGSSLARVRWLIGLYQYDPSDNKGLPLVGWQCVQFSKLDANAAQLCL